MEHNYTANIVDNVLADLLKVLVHVQAHSNNCGCS